MTAAQPNDRTALLVHAYVDGELDPANALAIEQRLASEPALAAERARVDALRRALRESLPREPVPPGLEQRIRRAVGATARRQQPTWLALAASVLIAVFASSGSTWYALQPPAGDSANEAAIAGHIRGLMAPQPTDIASSDRHTVKPWFAGRIPQAPRVIDLTAEGFPLVGGRIDVVGRAGVPTLVYRRRAHVISLTAIPDAGQAKAAVLQTAQGFNVLRWTAEGIAYWAVSDLNPGELEQFARLFREAPP